MTRPLNKGQAGRDHRSIREVLDLLVEEFPDVTISKIRFLESRGLIHPERTPSGYRKFYDGDIDRLRWILRQQREHFLPLKVIKGRLEQVGEEEVPVAAQLFETAHQATEDRSLVTAGISLAAFNPGAATGFENAPSLPERSTLDSPVDQRPSMARMPIRHQSLHPSGSAMVGERESAKPLSQRSTGPTSRRTEPTDASEVTATPAATTGKRNSSRSGDAPAARTSAKQGSATGGGARPPAKPVNPDLSGASLTLDELAHTLEVDAAVISELQEFGLITPRAIAGVPCYDEEALLVARIACSFRRFGIEARHLRAFKHAAEREASLFGQVVAPLLRQRNPESRELAHTQLDELAELGAALSARFVQAELHQITGG